ncbi:MAG: DinB family protein [Candidatus Heimdallarchaeota archaeon]|nr:DinB family protein [Candidatus Heimdallarchaeota archaeon]
MEIVSVQSFLNYYEKIWNRTLRVIDTIPPDKINWKPNSDAFSFKDILVHLVNLERYLFIETVINNLNKYPGHSNLEINDMPNLHIYLKTMHNESVMMLKGISDEDLNTRCTTPDNASIRVWKWLRAMIEHHIHHRGQIYTYLNLIQTQSPPLYGLTSEEVRDRGKMKND